MRVRNIGAMWSCGVCVVIACGACRGGCGRGYCFERDCCRRCQMGVLVLLEESASSLGLDCLMRS